MKKKVTMKLLFVVVIAFVLNSNAQGQDQSKINKGPFQPATTSFENYSYPEWFRDAKFGIWAHWGPQAVPKQGDWYAKEMYMQGSSDYEGHLKRYGHPSKFGYKDIIPLWKAQKWDPNQLMALYKKAGAKYFVSMGSHHDNFFLWDSRIHRWNSVKMGPHKDVVGLWQIAAKKEGLRFGVSEHLAASYNWFQTSHDADTSGAFKGVPYDGDNSEFDDLYHPKADPSDRKNWLTNNEQWHKEWYNDVKELVDTYHPDLLYSDSGLPFGQIGKDMLANFYNGNITYNKGELTAVYTCKQPSNGMWAQDVERGVQDSISPFPWQTDTSIGDWFYKTGQKYKTSTDVLQMLVDIVSKNGNLLLNIVQTPEGDLEPELINTLGEIGKWMYTNGEGIYGTRPWVIYGEGPSTIRTNQVKGQFGGVSDFRNYQSRDIRFTTKNNVLYAFCLNADDATVKIKSLGKDSNINKKKILSVSRLGSNAEVQWQQTSEALVIQGAKKDQEKVVCFKITMN
nr:alpha-L-fucosidase [uncultured Pedobacter sp.]